MGYATDRFENFSIGVRGKVLFGVVMADLRDWEYGIQTSESGDEVILTNSGVGRLSVPFDVDVKYGRIQGIDTKGAAAKYFGSFQNPGFAVDLGIDYSINEQSRFSMSISDLGGIWFRHNAYNIDQNSSYNFTGFDLTNSLDKDNSSK